MFLVEPRMHATIFATRLFVLRQTIKTGLLSFKENLAFADVPNGLAAFSKIPPLGTLQIILAIGVHELFVMKQVEGSFPGDMTTGEMCVLCVLLCGDSQDIL